MKTLPESFERSGFHHRVEFREGNIAVYRRWKEGQQSVHFETIVIREQKERTFGTAVLPASETYPAPEDWGKRGWTYLSIQEARSKADLLLAKSKQD